MLDAAQWVARRQMILRNAKAMMAKAQDRYASAVNKKRREITFKVGEKVWLDSKNFEFLQSYLSSGPQGE